MPISKDDFKNALRCFASGVTVVTTKNAAGELHGITVSAFCSVSLEPPQILICIEKNAGSCDAIAENGSFVVNILSQSQQNLSDQFASILPNKFAGVKYRTNSKDIPVLEDVLVNLECNITHSYDGGDHTVFIGEVENSFVADGNPLVYFDGQYREINQ